MTDSKCKKYVEGKVMGTWTAHDTYQAVHRFLGKRRMAADHSCLTMENLLSLEKEKGSQSAFFVTKC